MTDSETISDPTMTVAKASGMDGLALNVPDNDESKIPKFTNKALYCLGPENPLRKHMIKIAYSNWFEAASISIILANCIFLAISDPLDTDINSPRNTLIASSEHVFNVLFTIELLVKVIAMSFWSGPDSYMKDTWNWLDFFIVLLGWVAYAPGVDNISALRTFRVLRPLKTLSSMPGMRVITNALLRSVPSLLNVMVLCIFTFVIFGILGVQLYNGVLDGACFISDPNTGTRPPFADHNWQTLSAPNQDGFDGDHCMMYEKADWPANVASEVMITKESGGRICEPIDMGGGRMVNRYCGRNYDAHLTIQDGKGTSDPFHENENLRWNSTEWSGTRYAKGKFMSFGTGNFDNIGRAFLSIYTSITLEGWVDIMYALYDAFGVKPLTAFYFVVMILFGSFFMLNLCLAVVEGAMGDAEEDLENEIAAEKEHEAEEAAAHPELHPVEVKVPAKKGGFPYFRSIVQSANPNGSTMFENFIIFAILANTLVMALESYDPNSVNQATFDNSFTEALDICNDIFTWIFVIELILKLLGLGLREYAADRMNRFDFLITVIPVVEFVIKHVSTGDSGGSGVGALRSFRLFRLFKLARSWKDLNNLLHSLAESIAGCVNAALLLSIIMFIFTLLGIQLFGGLMATCQPIEWRTITYVPWDITKEYSEQAADPNACANADEPARGHFDYFWWAFVTVFQVLTGENWNEVLYYAIDGTSWEVAAIYFVLLNVVGNYIIFNIFLAILLGNMEDDGSDDDEEDDAGATKYEVEGTSAKVMPEGEEDEEKPKFDRIAEQEPPEIVLGGTAFWILPVDSPIRMYTFSIIKSSRFDNFILFLIFVSSVMLAIEQPFLENCGSPVVNGETAWKFPNLAYPTSGECGFLDVLKVIDLIITILFLCECVIKVFSLGFVMHKNAYLRNNWNKLDFFIVCISIVNMANVGGGKMAALKSLRSMRALRPLRLLSRNPGMKLVVNSILKGLPEIGNVVVVCLLFYLIFAIIGVQNWKGALNQCNNDAKICHPGVTIDPEHPALLCCSGDWSDRDCSKCKDSDPFPYGLACTEEIACGTGDALVAGDYRITATDTAGSYQYTKDPLLKYATSNAQGGTGGYFHVTAETCGMLSDDAALALCEQLAYCSVFEGGYESYEEVVVKKYDYVKKMMVDVPQKATYNVNEVPQICQDHPAETRFMKEQFRIKEAWGPQAANFDDVLHGLLTVFECSSGEMWPNIMYAIQDSVGQDQPFTFEYGIYWTPLYFIAIQIMCAFLLLNLFVGVLVEQYNSMKDGDGAGPLITEQQKMWLETQRLALDCAPERKVVPPQNAYQRWMFGIVESRAFELVIMSCIMLNIVTMAMRVYDQSDGYANVLKQINLVFVAIFSVEMFLKLYALEPTEYFKRNWNRFDFCIVVLSWVGILFDLGSFASLFRVARVARIFRLVQTNKNLATLFQTLIMSLPAIGNVASVTLLALFVYAVMGMNLFAKVKLGDNLGPHSNFRSFFGSLMLLFRMSTGESYNGVMHDCRIEEPACSNAIGDCGQPGIAEFYFLTFFVVSAMLMLNILVAIILDNYGDQEEQEQHFEKVGPEDMQVFKQVWAEKDPLARGSIDSNDLEWIIMHLPEPLGLAMRSQNQQDSDGMAKLARNKMKSLDRVPECGGKVYFHHVLRELVKNVHSDVDVSNLANNPRMSELDDKAKNNKFERRAKKQARGSDNNKQNGDPWSVAESTASLRLQTAWRGKMCRKTLPNKKEGSVQVIDDKGSKPASS